MHQLGVCKNEGQKLVPRLCKLHVVNICCVQNSYKVINYYFGKNRLDILLLGSA